eukprot:3874154-Pyramimonas_sp.AAC.1
MSVVIRQVHDVPWGTHCGLEVCAGESQPRRFRALALPADLPCPPRPQRQANPNSKTSLRKKAALDKRRNQLPDMLQEAFDELTQSQEDAAAPPVLSAADVDYVDGVDFAINLDLWRRHQDDMRSMLSTPDENGTLGTHGTRGPPEKAGSQLPPGKSRLLEGAQSVFCGTVEEMYGMPSRGAGAPRAHAGGHGPQI